MQMSTKVYMEEGGSKSPKTGLRSLWTAPHESMKSGTLASDSGPHSDGLSL